MDQNDQDELVRLRAERETFVKAAANILPYLRWSISDESPGYHPTAPSAIGAFESVFVEPVQEQRVRLYGERPFRDATSEDTADGNLTRVLGYVAAVMVDAAYGCQQCKKDCGPVKAINEAFEVLAPFTVLPAPEGSWQESAANLERAIEDFMADLDRRARWDKDNVDKDGVVTLPCGVGVLFRMEQARQHLGAIVANSLVVETT